MAEEEKAMKDVAERAKKTKKDPFGHNEKLEGIGSVIKKIYKNNDKKAAAKREFERRMAERATLERKER